MSPFLSRRDFIHLAAGSLAVAGLAGKAVAAAPPLSQPEARPTMHVYDNYGWLRGLNCIPSWGARIEEAWWSYDPARFREEVALVRRIHGNCIRLWIEYTAWMADPEKVMASFLDAVKAIDEAGMKTMPCLFNRWHDQNWDYGGTYTEDIDRPWNTRVAYVQAIVRPLAADPRILIWDLCNEPQGNPPKEYEWLKAMGEAVRAAGAKQPITIGTMTGGNIEKHAPLMDVLCGHPYARDRAGLAKLIESFQAMSKKFGKPFLVNECVPGCLDDAKRAETARYYSEMLAEAGSGWMGWSIREGKAIATRRDRTDGNGIDNQGFHPWFTAEGKLRGGLDFLLDPPKLRAPWEKA